MTVDALITDTASRLLAEVCTHSTIQQAEAQGEAPEIWQAFAETGFPWISLPEEAGGSGGTLLDALEGTASSRLLRSADTRCRNRRARRVVARKRWSGITRWDCHCGAGVALRTPSRSPIAAMYLAPLTWSRGGAARND